MHVQDVRAAASAMMSDVLDDLAKLVSHPSVAFPGFPSEPVNSAAIETLEVLKRYGFRNLELRETGGYPTVWADMPGPDGAPTVLLYAHYDVQPAPPEQDWRSDPWTLTRREDGRYYGRGAADDKSGIMIHAGMMRVFGGTPPVSVKVCIEGEEETVSHMEEFVEQNPELFQADVMIITDMGNLAVGEPALATTLRGDVECVVEVSTMKQALHSGLFGGPVPDALVTLVRILDSLHDEDGSTSVEGLKSYEWPGTEFPAEVFREQSGMLEGVQLVGTGKIASRLWSKPSVTVLGIDAPSVAEAANVLIPEARAKLSMRIAPGEDPKTALDALMTHCSAAAPWGAHVVVRPTKALYSFEADTAGPVVAAAREALAEAYGTEPSEVGSGGSIPLLTILHNACSKAEFVLWGAEDMAQARIHGGNESVDPNEIERMIAAQALLANKLAERLSADGRA